MTDSKEPNAFSILKSRREYDPLCDNITEETVLPVKSRRVSFSNLKSNKKEVDLEGDNLFDETKGRRVSFSNLKVIKEFVVDSEKNTVWDDTYEEPVVHSSASTVSTDNTESYSKQNTTFATLPIESDDKENAPLVIIDEPLDLTVKPINLLPSSTPLIRPLSVLKNVPIKKIHNLNQTVNDDDMELTGMIVNTSVVQNVNPFIMNADKSLNATGLDMELTCVLDEHKPVSGVNCSIDQGQKDDCNQTSKLINISNVDMEITGLYVSEHDSTPVSVLANSELLLEPLIPSPVSLVDDQQKTNNNYVNQSLILQNVVPESVIEPPVVTERNETDHDMSFLAKQTENMHLSVCSEDMSLMNSSANISSPLSSTFSSFSSSSILTDNDKMSERNRLYDAQKTETQHLTAYNIYKDALNDTVNSSCDVSIIANEKCAFLVSHSVFDENAIVTPANNSIVHNDPLQEINDNSNMELELSRHTELSTKSKVQSELQVDIPQSEMIQEIEPKLEQEPKLETVIEKIKKLPDNNKPAEINDEEQEFVRKLESVESKVEKLKKNFEKSLEDSGRLWKRCIQQQQSFLDFVKLRNEKNNWSVTQFSSKNIPDSDVFWSLPLKHKCELFCYIFTKVKIESIIENCLAVRLYGILFLVRIFFDSGRKLVKDVTIEHILHEETTKKVLSNQFCSSYLSEMNLKAKIQTYHDIFKYFAILDSHEISKPISSTFFTIYMSE